VLVATAVVRVVAASATAANFRNFVIGLLLLVRRNTIGPTWMQPVHLIVCRARARAGFVTSVTASTSQRETREETADAISKDRCVRE
jgi:hypothetical protein